MVTISPSDSDFKKAVATYLAYKLGVNIQKLSEEQFETACNLTRQNFGGETEERMIQIMRFQAHQERRVRQTGIVLLTLWLLMNAWMIIHTPISTLLTWKLAAWIPLSWCLVMWGVGFIIPFFNHLAPSYVAIGSPGVILQCIAHLWWWSKIALICWGLKSLFQWWFNIF